METIVQARNFLKQAAQHNDLSAFHISLYLIICFYSKEGDLHSGFRNSRSRIMRLAHIRGRTAYHRYLKDLINLGYLIYTPSYHPQKASVFKLKTLP